RPSFPTRRSSDLERGSRIDLALPLRSEFGEIVRVAESGQHPVRFSLDQGIAEIGEGTPGEISLLVQNNLERAGHRAFDRGPAQFAIALGSMRIADRQ